MIESASMKNNFYDSFHKNTQVQKKVVKSNNFTYKHILSLIDKYIRNKKRVIDIGCGAGTLSFYIANKGIQITGIDVSLKAIKACQISAKNMGLANNARFKAIKFPKESINEKFDLVIFTEVIEHLNDDKLALKKIFYMLKKGGIVIITTPSLNAPLYKIGYAFNFDKEVGHIRRYTIDGLSKECESIGFKVIETKKIEGILRNFLFINPYAGKMIRFIKYFVSDVVTFIDNILIHIFGESNIVIVLKKI